MLDALQIDIWPPFAGLMIFLLAMGFIESAIKKLAGRKVKEVIASNTDHPVRGVLTGTVATALLQSSSLVSLLVLAFVGARIMRLKQALLTVFGANLGTTATGWVVALVGFKLDLDAISLPMIAVFGLLFTAVKDGKLKQFGQLGLGVGLLLLALQYMKSALGDAGTTIGPDMLAGFALWQYALFGIAAAVIDNGKYASIHQGGRQYTGRIAVGRISAQAIFEQVVHAIEVRIRCQDLGSIGQAIFDNPIRV